MPEKENASGESDARPKFYSTVLVLSGFCMLAIGCIVKLVTAASEAHAVTHPSADTWELFCGFAVRLTIEFLVTLGIAAIIAGGFNLLLDLKEWRNYFKSALQSVVMEEGYLKKMSREQLALLQVSTVKAMYAADDLDREGGFLLYFQDRLQRLLREPYREEMNCIWSVEGEDGDNFRILDTISYTCRAVGGSIQDSIVWACETGELARIEKIVFKATNPAA